MKFFPKKSQSYKCEGILSYDKMNTYIELSGTAYTGNVDLSKKHLKLDKTYIQLQA